MRFRNSGSCGLGRSGIGDPDPFKANSNMNTTTSTAPTASQNLVETAAANDTFKTFSRAVEHAGLSDTLKGPGPFTVFAPTDAAFKKLPDGKLEGWFKPENKQELVSVLNYHLINGRKSAADIGKWESARTINGQPAPIKMVGQTLSIDGAEITNADILSSNGVIHGIDKVNIPTVSAPAPAAVAAVAR